MSGDHNMNQNDFHPDWICTCGDLTTLGIVHRKDAPCYHPDKREWVGLTDEEVDEFAMDESGLPNSHLEFARAIEAKLKEKNT